ncbi:MAG: hypothetical protein SFY32_09795 [Bacteroidota bacterium]|nr:hypothetical protein [Bacteroidota bacterium]
MFKDTFTPTAENPYYEFPKEMYGKEVVIEDSAVEINNQSNFIETKIDKIKKLFTILDSPRVLKFLFLNPNLIDTLLDAKLEIQKRFGDVKTKLELVHDEELEDWVTLFFIISTKINLKDFNNFLMEWVFLQSIDFKRKVNFSTN